MITKDELKSLLKSTKTADACPKCLSGKGGAMICCDACDQWMHIKCFNVSKKESNKARFICLVCKDKTNAEQVKRKAHIQQKKKTMNVVHDIKKYEATLKDKSVLELTAALEAIKVEILESEHLLLKIEDEKQDVRVNEFKVPPLCIPICQDVTRLPWKQLGKEQQKYTGRKFDVITMDPPWQLASANPTRGVAIAYQQLSDELISKIPIQDLQDEGWLLIWVINVKFHWTIKQMKKWGYEVVDELVWVKLTVNRRSAKGHGYYLQHAKETILVGKKGKVNRVGGHHDLICAERKGQSQKPVDIYKFIENHLSPGGSCLEVFGRRNNLRDGWVTVGNEL